MTNNRFSFHQTCRKREKFFALLDTLFFFLFIYSR